MVLMAQSSVGRTRRGRGSSLWPAASPEPETDSSWFEGTAVAGNRPPAHPKPRSPRRQQQSPAHAQEERGGHRGGRAPGPGTRHHSGAGPRGHPASGLGPWGPQLRVPLPDLHSSVRVRETKWTKLQKTVRARRGGRFSAGALVSCS